MTHSNTNPRSGQYLTHAHSHITRVVAAMDSCFGLATLLINLKMWDFVERWVQVFVFQKIYKHVRPSQSDVPTQKVACLAGGISCASAYVLVAKPWTRVAKPWEDWWSVELNSRKFNSRLRCSRIPSRASLARELPYGGSTAACPLANLASYAGY